MSEVIVGGGAGATASEDVAKLAVPSSRVVVIESETSTPPSEDVKNQPTPQDATKPADPADPSTKGEDSGADDGDGFYVGDFDMTALAEEFQKDGKLSEESYKELEESGFSRELVDTYIRGVQSAAAEAGELAKEHVDAIIAEVGGLEKFEAVMKWADGKLSQEDKEQIARILKATLPPDTDC